MAPLSMKSRPDPGRSYLGPLVLALGTVVFAITGLGFTSHTYGWAVGIGLGSYWLAIAFLGLAIQTTVQVHRRIKVPDSNSQPGVSHETRPPSVRVLSLRMTV